MLLVPNVFINPRDDRAKVMQASPKLRREKDVDLYMEPRPESPLRGLTGVVVRFKEIRILDNHASTILGKDKSANIYPIVMAVSDAASNAYDLATRNVFNDIKDNDCLPIANALSVARYYSRIPLFLDIHLAIVKSNERTRDVAKMINEAVTSEEGQAITTTLNTVISGANLLAGTITSIATSLLALITDCIAKTKDEQIFYGVASFEDDPDNLGIDGLKIMTDEKNARAAFEVIGQRT
jgi:hypothetical protein